MAQPPDAGQQPDAGQPPAACPTPTSTPTDAEVAARFGSLPRRAPLRPASQHAFFDSADWALSLAARRAAGAGGAPTPLAPKLAPGGGCRVAVRGRQQATCTTRMEAQSEQSVCVVARVKVRELLCKKKNGTKRNEKRAEGRKKNKKRRQKKKTTVTPSHTAPRVGTRQTERERERESRFASKLSLSLLSRRRRPAPHPRRARARGTGGRNARRRL